MATTLLQDLLHFIQLHPLLAGLIVFLVAFSESLAIVGLFMPGAVLMFAFGMLISGGQLDFTATLVWAVLGAVLGDGLSFWFGRHYHQRLKTLWPFRRYPQLIARGTDFFSRHGSKSILLGRFVGPVRPIIPAIAGMLEMPWPRFTLVNLVSALLWAPAYLLPGMAFGASLGLAAEVAGRLVIMVLVVLALLLLSIWLVRRLNRLLQPRSNPLIQRVLHASRGVPYLGPIAEGLLDPHHPETRSLGALFALLLLTTLGIGLLLQPSLYSDGVGVINLVVYNLLQGLRSEWMDGWLLWLSQFGSLYFLLPFAALLGLALLLARDYATALYLLVTLALAETSALLLKGLSAVERPPVAADLLSSYAFPSGHTVMATVFFGFLAVVYAGRMPGRWRWLPYSFATGVVALVALSRVYLGLHWLLDVVFGAVLGLAWVALAGIAYRRHHRCVYPAATLLGGSTVVFLIALMAYASFAPSPTAPPLGEAVAARDLEPAAWLATEWQALPAYRDDLRRYQTQAFNLQWAGDADALRQQLLGWGWQAGDGLRPTNLLRFLAPTTDAGALPVPPHFHHGQAESLLFTRPLGEGRGVAVVRLWRSPHSLHADASRNTPLWYGDVSTMGVAPIAAGLSMLRTDADTATPLRLLDTGVASGHCRLRQRVSGVSVLLCEAGV